MWNTFENMIMESHELQVNYEDSFYCGDSAGRIVNPQTKKPDLSDTDLKFSLNSSLVFKVPEDVFCPTKSIKFQ